MRVMENSLSILGGLGLGAGIMYFCDPNLGRRRRGLVRDKAVSVFSHVDDYVGKVVRDVSQRATGVQARIRSRFSSDDAPDTRIADRVRAKMGRYVSHPGAIDVSVQQGVVTLSGPILERELDDFLSAVDSVTGVVAVENQLVAHKRPDNVSALQGGRGRPGERYDLMQDVWSPATRMFVGSAGAGLAAYGLTRPAPQACVLGTIGLALLARAATNIPMAQLLGFGSGRRAIEVQKTITIAAPVERVYAFWTDFQNFPNFMSHVRKVHNLGNGRSRWVADGPGGSSVHWDAVVTQLVPNERIAWKTVAESPIAHAGIVKFEPEPFGQTRVDIRFSYNPPGGALGHALALVFGADPKSRMDDDLMRMKTFLETGIPPHDAAKPEAGPVLTTVP